MQQTMQQQRAAYALNKVKAASTNPTINQKEYKSYASQLPAMIHMNGLGQAAAFFRAKKGTYLELYQVLSEWLCKDQQPYQGCKDLLEGITTKDLHHYRLAQAEAQMLMDWVKKFAKAYMTGDED
jgi:CRISPR-associated protein Cmr5